MNVEIKINGKTKWVYTDDTETEVDIEVDVDGENVFSLVGFRFSDSSEAEDEE